MGLCGSFPLFPLSLRPPSTSLHQQVFDRVSRTMVPCTASSCPYATPVQGSEIPPSTGGSNGPSRVLITSTPTLAVTSRHLNRAPFSPSQGRGWLAGVSSLSSAAYQRSAFEFFSNLTSPEASWAFILNRPSGKQSAITNLYAEYEHLRFGWLKNLMKIRRGPCQF